MNNPQNITMAEVAEVLRIERPRLMRYACYRLGDTDDAKDALQDVFLKLHAHLSGVKSAKVDDLRNYLFRTLSNLCTTRLSRQQKLHIVPLNAHFDRVEPATENFEDDFRRIARLLSQIPEEQAEVIRLRMYGDNSFAEVADILSLPLPTVKSRFLYGLDKIRRGMQHSADDGREQPFSSGRA